MLSAGIIGLGKVGRTLAISLANNNVLSWTCSFSIQSDNFIKGIPNYPAISEIQSLPDIVLIARTDSLIEKTIVEIIQHFDDKLNGKTIAHLSGSLSLSLLKPLSEKGAKTASAHPYQTFYSGEESILRGISWLIESEDNTDAMKELISITGGNPIIVKPGSINRDMYHASAIIASNFLNTLVYFSKITASKSGIDAAQFLPHILKTTTENIISSLKNETSLPLTGPIIRSDFGLIGKHLQALLNEPEIRDFYSKLSELTGIAAKSEGLIVEEDLRELVKLIKSE